MSTTRLFVLSSLVLGLSGVVACAPSAEEESSSNEAAATATEKSALDATLSAELTEGGTTTAIGAPKKIAALVKVFKAMKPTPGMPRCAPPPGAPKVVLKDAKNATVLETSGCVDGSLYIKLPSGVNVVEAAQALAPFKEKAVLGDVLFGEIETFTPDGDRLLDTGVDLAAEMVSAVPRCMVPTDAPVITYKREGAVAATATLLIDCSGDDLSKVPAKLAWKVGAEEKSTWITLDYAKATGIGGSSSSGSGGLGGLFGGAP